MRPAFFTRGRAAPLPARPAMPPIYEIPGDPEHVRRAVEARQWVQPAWATPAEYFSY